MFLLTFIAGVFIGAFGQWQMAKARNGWLKSSLQQAIQHADNLMDANKQLVTRVQELKIDLCNKQNSTTNEKSTKTDHGVADAIRYLKQGIRI